MKKIFEVSCDVQCDQLARGCYHLIVVWYTTGDDLSPFGREVMTSQVNYTKFWLAVVARMHQPQTLPHRTVKSIVSTPIYYPPPPPPPKTPPPPICTTPPPPPQRETMDSKKVGGWVVYRDRSGCAPGDQQKKEAFMGSGLKAFHKEACTQSQSTSTPVGGPHGRGVWWSANVPLEGLWRKLNDEGGRSL